MLAPFGELRTRARAATKTSKAKTPAVPPPVEEPSLRPTGTDR